MCLVDVPNNSVFRKWCAAVGDCGDVLTKGVPVLNEFYQIFRRNGTDYSDGFKREIFKNTSQLYLSQGLAAGSIDAHARVSFYYAFGILPDHQVAIEDHFRKVTIRELGQQHDERPWLVVQPGNNIVTVQ
jgi:hypothetical protein